MLPKPLIRTRHQPHAHSSRRSPYVLRGGSVFMRFFARKTVALRRQYLLVRTTPRVVGGAIYLVLYVASLYL